MGGWAWKSWYHQMLPFKGSVKKLRVLLGYSPIHLTGHAPGLKPRPPKENCKKLPVTILNTQLRH